MYDRNVTLILCLIFVSIIPNRINSTRSGGFNGFIDKGGKEGGSTTGGGKGFGGSLRSSRARAAAAFIAGYRGDRSVHNMINSGASSIYVPSYSRTYYYGNRYYIQGSSDFATCHYVINDDDDYFFNFTYQDTGLPLTEIVYECSNYHYCCDGLDCCYNVLPTWAGVVIAASVALSAVGFIALGIYIYSRGPIDIKKRLSEKIPIRKMRDSSANNLHL